MMLEGMQFLEHAVANDIIAAGECTYQLPSIFELIMQEKLAMSIKYAAQYIVRTLEDTYPSHFLLNIIAKHSEEFYTFLRLLTEKFCLHRFDCMLTERFYGLTRVVQIDTAPTSHRKHLTSAPHNFTSLSSKKKTEALFYELFVPYCKAKLDACYNKRKRETGDSESSTATQTHSSSYNETYWNRLKAYCHNCYPLLHFFYESAFFTYKWMYLFGDSIYASPLHRKARIVLIRSTAKHEEMFAKREEQIRNRIRSQWSNNHKNSIVQRVFYSLLWKMMDNIYLVVLLSSAGFKVVEWLYSVRRTLNERTRAIGCNASIPPPPLPPKIAGQALLTTLDPSLCQLCLRRRTNPAASVSGYVFCYPCIYEYVSQHGCCPVTRIQGDVSTIVKVYDARSMETR